MLFRRVALLRRLTACVLALCFGMFTAEALIADVHDGDATHEELVQVDGASTHATAHVAHGDQTAGASAIASADAESAMHATPDADASSDSHPGERFPQDAGHGSHTCHGPHAHGCWTQPEAQLEVALTNEHSAPVSLGDQTLSSRDREPQLRPPIA